MIRNSLKRNKRPKALFGADGAAAAAAILTAAGIQAGATTASSILQSKATADAAKQQSSAIIQQAKQQAESLKLQSQNNTQLQKESLDFTREQNEQNRQQQQDIQATLQLLAGQQNVNERNQRTRVAVKYGGRKRKLRNTTPSYGGLNVPFTVTDGGGVLPLDIDENGYGLYEIYGNDHKHYHKAQGGKNKTGVGIKFSDGSVVEGEGNQNTSKGEKLFITPNDAMFISKHSIDGFNPSDAVDNGMNPYDAFELQELLKLRKGYTNDGKTINYKNRNKKLAGGINNILNNVSVPDNSGIIGGAIYSVNNPPVEDMNNGRYSLKRGGRIKADGGFWNNYGAATIASAGNFLGAGIGMLMNNRAGRRLARAYGQAGDILADAYNQMHGIDMSEIKREDYNPAHAMAAISSTDVNANPQLERLRRNASAERNLVNRSTLSSAARQQRLAGINDRMYQRIGEVEADRYNRALQIAQGNAERITDVSKVNAELDSQALKDYTNTRLNLLQYNNDIENQKIGGAAQARADAITQGASARAQFRLANANILGSALTSIGGNFSTAIESNRKREADYNNIYMGLDREDKINAVLTTGDTVRGQALYDQIEAELNYATGERRTELQAQLDILNKRLGVGSKNSNNTIQRNNSTIYGNNGKIIQGYV